MESIDHLEVDFKSFGLDANELSRMKFPASMLDLHRYQSTAHGHDFDGLSRVVMVRKTDQRTFASTKNGEEPKFETITRETIETFHGNRTERKVTSLEKREGIRKSPDLGFHSSSELIHQNGTGAHSKTTTPKKVSSLKKKQPGAKSPEEFANECLEAHNEYRTKHGVPPLTLSKKLCKISQKWADKIAAKGSLEQSNNTDYGENIYCSWSSAADYQPTGREPVDSWYEESKRHQYGTEPNDLRSGHFTQVIWKETTELGVAYSRGKNGRIYVVANYSPPGNFIGDFAENVPPPIDTSKPYTMSGLPTTPSSKSTPTPRPPSSSSTGAEGDFEVDCLNAHNEYRRMHGVEPLKLNRKMCKYSEEWAKALAIKGQMEHRKNSEYGENIYCSWSSNSNHRINGREAVDQWYSEVKIHVFGREPNNLKSGHFTQVVWRDSRELGVAVAKNRNGQIFVVANYSPPGNFVGSFAENVLPLGGGSKHETKAQAMKTYSLSDFSIEGVRHHNELRKKHNVPELKHNEDQQLRSRIEPEANEEKGIPNIEYQKQIPKTDYQKDIPFTKIPQAKSPEKFAQECLEAHNQYRLKHRVPPLILSKKLCEVSQKWADKTAAKGTLEQSKTRKFGENLYCSRMSGPDYEPSGYESVESWYEEQRDYQYGIEPPDLHSSHFTQIVWKNTKEMGVAYSLDKNGCVYVVAKYYPPGNVFGHFNDNVLPPGGDPISELSDNNYVHATFKPSEKSTTPSEGDGEGYGRFEIECLKAHNEYRKLHGAEPLKLTPKLCKYSEEWAHELAVKGVIKHRQNPEYGENVYCTRTPKNGDMIGKEPVDQWYSEVKTYTFGREPRCIHSCGHFTQVIWKGSRELGIAIAKSHNQYIFVVANYLPPGNIVGEFTENVLPPAFGKILESQKPSMKSISLSRISIKSAYSKPIKYYNSKEFSEEGVRIHNQYRKKHHVPALKYSEKLTTLAQDWANKLAIDDRFYHRPDIEYGESLFYSWVPNENAIVTPSDVCKFWYAEVKDYIFTSEPNNMRTGHFTQMVWKNTHEMGMAMARGLNGKIYVVANYNPRGNVVGEFMANVSR